MLRTIALLLGLLQVLACDGSGAGNGGDAGVERDGKLQFTTTAPLLMPPRGSANLVAVLKDDAGRPVRDARVELGLVGLAPGASLNRLAARTDAQGRVRATLRAGSDAASFKVRASTPRARPALLEVEVEAILLARLDVEARYRGQRKLATRTLTAVADVTCKKVLANNLIGDFVQTIPSPKTNAAFDLDPRAAYAVVAWGRDASGALLARGCVESGGPLEEVFENGDGHLTALLEDHAMAFDVAYEDVQLEIDVLASAQRLGAFTRGAATSLLPGGDEPDADFVLDAIEQRLRDTGQDAEADQLAQARASGTLAISLGGALDTEGVGASFVLEGVATTFEGQSASLHVNGQLTGSELALTLTKLSARATDGLTQHALDDAFTQALLTEVQSSYDDATAKLRLDRLALGIPLGVYGRELFAVLRADTALNFEAQLTAAMGCDVVARWASRQNAIKNICNSSCVTAACNQALDALNDGVAAGLSALDVTHPELAFGGSLEVFDRDEDHVIDGVSAAQLAGAWGQDANQDLTTCVLSIQPSVTSP